MSSDRRSAAEIEQELEHERAAFARSLSALEERFSIEGMARQLTDQVSRHGSDIGHSVGRSVKDNPIALALSGIGLAWLMFGNGPGYRTDGRGDGRADGHAMPRARTGSSPYSAGLGDPAESLGSGSDGHRTSMRESMAHAGSAASDRWDRMSTAAGRYGRNARASAADMRRRLYEGTESMSEQARERVIAARDAAWRAQANFEASARSGMQGARHFFEEQPLVTGALVLAVGAALGAALPRTRTEDEAVGAWSDDVFDEAERVYREEMQKARKVAEAATEEAKTVVQEKKAEADAKAPGDKTALQEAGDQAKDAAGRVAGAAKAEAERQDLGGSGSSRH